MALSRKVNEAIPKDAVLLNEEQALQYQWKIITGWDTTKDVWALKYTPGIIGALSAVTGIYLNDHYRTKLKLGNYGKLSSYLPIVVIPAMFSVLAHKFFVQRSIILRPLGECPLCTQLRAAVFQSSIGVLYPTLLAPMAGFMFATRHFTYRLPSVTEKPLEVLKLWQKMTRPIVPLLGTLIVGQSLITMYLTYKEADQSMRLQAHIQQLERNLENSEEELEY